MSTRDLRKELRVSRDMLEQRTGTSVESVSYPFGRYSERVIQEAREAGYRWGFASSPTRGYDEMAIGRMSVYCIDGDGALKRKLGIDAGYGLECLKNRIIAGLSRGTTIVKR